MVLRSGFALLAGALLAQAFEPVGLALLLPLGIAGLVLSVQGLQARRAWLPGLTFGIGFHFTLQIWMAQAVGPDAWIALAGLQAAFHAPLGALAARVLRWRGGVVWFAVAWVAMETIRSGWPFSGMPWGRLPYAVAGTPWQAALPWIGMTALSFLLALLGALLAQLVLGERGRLTAVVATVGVAAASLLPALAPWSAEQVGERTVAVVQGDVPGDGSDILLDHRQVTRNHVDATTDLAAEVDAGAAVRPDFVVWPENSTAVDPFRTPDVNAAIVSASDAIDVPILVGAMVDAGPDQVLNQSIVWNPGVGAADRYSKWHPVPFGEYVPWRDLGLGTFGQLRLIPRDMLSGTREEPLPIADTLVAAAICFDVAYDDGIHTQLGNGGQLLVVQTSNAMFIHTDQIDQQFEMTRLRAIETGRHVLVASPNGVSGVIAPDGTVVARAGTRTQEVLQETVALVDAVPPGVRVGAWPGRIAVALAALAVLRLLLTYRRGRPQEGVSSDAGRADRHGHPDLQRA